MPPGRLSCRALARLAGIAAAIVGLATGGCSFSYPLGGFSAQDDAKAETASIKAAKPSEKASSSRLPTEPDLALAKAAVHDVLSRGDHDTSLPWENPRTGARGTVTPLAAVHVHDGVTCRDFLASYVRDGSASWLQGEACRAPRGKWEVKTLRPLNRT